MVANMWKNSLKNVESDNNKILYETLLNFFLQRNGTCFLNKPRTMSAMVQVTYSVKAKTQVTVHVISTCLMFGVTCVNHDGITPHCEQDKMQTLPHMTFNPLPSIMLQSAQDLNVPCQPKRSKVLLLSSS